jgi:hypothetical protein
MRHESGALAMDFQLQLAKQVRLSELKLSLRSKRISESAGRSSLLLLLVLCGYLSHTSLKISPARILGRETSDSGLSLLTMDGMARWEREGLRALADDGQVPGEKIVILDEVFAEQK